ncbi:MAG: hypothetical protein K0Q95_1166 [Bacteroidota bacterium]|nr:hypothetical protein [Bacteroidota bacterium]
MLRRLVIIISIVFLFFTSSAQQPWFHYDWSKTSMSDFAGWPEAVYKYDIQRYKDNMYVGKFYETFAEYGALNVKNDIIYGNFYKDSANDEAYVKRVLCSIIKDTSITNRVKIFLTRDLNLNASMSESGIIRLNIGTFAYLHNEAELAMLLGHETAHFLNQDGAKGFSSVIEERSHAWNTENSVIGLFTNYNWSVRADEASADLTGINYMKGSQYSLKSGSELFRQFKREQVRYELMYGKFLVRLASSTHPDPGDRMKQVKFLSNDTINKGKKNFVIDSVKFTELKQKGMQEVINLGLETNDLFTLTDLTFKNYLFNPTDQYNLAVLIECIRRTLILEKKDEIEKKPFILSRYQTDHAKDSENYSYLKDKKVSILNYLGKGFLDFGKEELSNIKASDLADPGVTEFASYAEAYEYFKQKSNELNCKICEHYKMFEPGADSIAKYNFSRINNLFATNDLLNAGGNLHSFKKTMVVLMPVELIKGNGVIERRSKGELKTLLKRATDTLAIGALKPTSFEELSYPDKHQIIALLQIAVHRLKIKPLEGVKKDNNDWTKTSPELYSFFKRNKVNTLYVCAAGLHQSLSTGQQQVFYYYKIAIPEKGTDCINVKMIEEIAHGKENDKSFLSKLHDSFSSFYYLTR